MILRRRFLLGASALAIAALLPAEIKAGINNPGSGVGNSGTPKVQINTGFVDGGTFKNWMLTYGSVQPNTAGFPFPSFLNVDQYPTGTIGSGLQGQALVPSNITSGTTCVLAWTGTAGLMGIQNGSPGFTVTAGGGFVSGSTAFNLNVTGTNGYVEFNWNGAVPTALTFAFANGATFNFSGLIICAKSDYASIVAATNAGQLISGAYVSVMKALSPKAVRPMQWSNPNNGNNFTQHKYRMNWQTALCYSPSAWIPNCWAGSSSGTNAYTASAATDTPVSYTMGEVLQLQFINAATTGSQTINVGARGIVPLFDMFGGALASNAITANALATLIYDDLLGGYMVAFNGLTCGVPVEGQVGLANQVGCALWYNYAPHITYKNTTMEPTSSVAQISTLLANTLNAGCNQEYANEVWNFGAGFQHTSWAVVCGAALGFPSGNNRQYHGFYALRVVQIMPLVTAAWGVKAGLKCVLGWQAFDGGTGLGGSLNTYRLQGADLSTGLGYTKYNSYVAANFNSSPNRPIDVCDSGAYATYYSGAQCSNFDGNYKNVGGTGLTTGAPSSGPGSTLLGLLGAADAFAAGGATNIANAIGWLDWDIRQGTNNGTAGGQTLLALKTGNGGIGIYPPWETVVASYDGAGRPAGKSNLTVDLYEGAMECAAPSTGECTPLGISTTYGGATGKIGNLLTAYKQSATFYATVQQQFSDFFARPHSKTASWFTLNNNSQWSMEQPPGDVNSAVWQSYPSIAAYNFTP